MRGADGDQPFSSHTVRMSVAVGPRRSRRSLEPMNRSSHLCIGVALGFVCFGCCVFALFAWLSTAAGPWGAGDAVRSVLILGGVFVLAGWGAVRNFRCAFRPPRMERVTPPAGAEKEPPSQAGTPDEKLAHLVRKPNDQPRL
jgi:hypothetical protein